MNKYTKIKDLHASRMTGVGASDIPILAGLTKKWGSTPLKLWRQKVGLDEPWNGNQRTEWGNKLEGLVLREFVSQKINPDIADEFFRFYMRELSRGGLYTYTEARASGKPYCMAHADLITDIMPEIITEASEEDPEKIIEKTIASEAIIEAKTSGAYAAKRRKGEIFTGYDPDDLSVQGIPDAVFLQVQWQMFCYNIPVAWVPVLIDTADFRIYGPIRADKKVQEECLSLAQRFWNLVENNIPPTPETWEDVQLIYPDRIDLTAMVGGEEETKVKEMISRYGQISSKIKDLESEQSDIKTAIGILLGSNRYLSSATGERLASVSSQERNSVKYKEALKAHPDWIAELEIEGLVKKSDFSIIRLKGEK